MCTSTRESPVPCRWPAVAGAHPANASWFDQDDASELLVQGSCGRNTGILQCSSFLILACCLHEKCDLVWAIWSSMVVMFSIPRNRHVGVAYDSSYIPQMSGLRQELYYTRSCQRDMPRSRSRLLSLSPSLSFCFSQFCSLSCSQCFCFSVSPSLSLSLALSLSLSLSLQTYMHTHVCAYLRTHVRTCIRTYLHSFIYSCKNARAQLKESHPF